MDLKRLQYLMAAISDVAVSEEEARDAANGFIQPIGFATRWDISQLVCEVAAGEALRRVYK